MPSVFFIDKDFIATKSEALPDEAACVARAATGGAALFQIDGGPPYYFGTIYNAAEIRSLAPDRFGGQTAKKYQIEQMLEQAGRTHAVMTNTGTWLVPHLTGQKIFDQTTLLPVLAVDELGQQILPPAPARPTDAGESLASRLSRRLV